MERSINWWNIINKLSLDNSLWDYLEPAEIMEIVQRIREAMENMKGFEKYVTIDLDPAIKKLESLVHLYLNTHILYY